MRAHRTIIFPTCMAMLFLAACRQEESVDTLDPLPSWDRAELEAAALCLLDSAAMSSPSMARTADSAVDPRLLAWQIRRSPDSLREIEQAVLSIRYGRPAGSPAWALLRLDRVRDGRRDYPIAWRALDVPGDAWTPVRFFTDRPTDQQIFEFLREESRELPLTGYLVRTATLPVVAEAIRRATWRAVTGEEPTLGVDPLAGDTLDPAPEWSRQALGEIANDFAGYPSRDIDRDSRLQELRLLAWRTAELLIDSISFRMEDLLLWGRHLDSAGRSVWTIFDLYRLTPPDGRPTAVNRWGSRAGLHTPSILSFDHPPRMNDVLHFMRRDDSRDYDRALSSTTVDWPGMFGRAAEINLSPTTIRERTWRRLIGDPVPMIATAAASR